METTELKRKQIKDIQRTEAIIIKRALNIPKRTRTTKLLYAVNLEPIGLKLQKQKLIFFTKIQDHDLLKQLIKYSIEKKKIKHSIVETVENIVQEEFEDIDSLNKKVEEKIKEIERKIKEESEDNSVKRIRDILRGNEIENRTNLLELIKAF